MNVAPPTPRTWLAGWLPAACLVTMGLLLSSCSAADTEPGAAPQVAIPTVSLPDLTGMEPADAWGVLTRAGIDWLDDKGMFHDLTVLHREVPAWDWQIYQTVPAPGTRLKQGDPVIAFALKQDEYAFYQRNQTMPRTGWTKGRYVPSYFGDTFRGMGDLMETRYAPGLAPHDAKRTRDWPDPTSGLPRRRDPSVEPRKERKLRAALKEADDANLFVTTIPPPGAPLRAGRMLTFVVRPHPDVEPGVYGIEPEDSGDLHLDFNYRHDDDDWDVPGWLCPTRFC